MKPNKLNLGYPILDRYNINGETYTVNAAFDVILRVMDLLEDKEIFPEERVETALEMLIGTDLGDLDDLEKSEVLRGILGMYVQLEPEKEYDITGEEIPVKFQKKEEKQFDYKHDADLIYGGILQTYGIDLFDMQGKLHWLKFNAMIKCLPEETQLSKIIGYRSYDPSNEKKKRRTIMMERKKLYALPDSEEVD